MESYNTNFSIFKAFLWVLLYVIIVELCGATTLVIETFGYNTVSYFYAGLLSLLIIYLLLKRVNIEGLTFNLTDNRWWLISIFLGIFFKFILIPLNLIYDWITIQSHKIKFDNNFQVFINEFSLNHIASIFFIPIAEELFFRDFIQRSLQKKFLPSFAILITSILFASIHLYPINYFFFGEELQFHWAYTAFWASVLYGLVFYKSKSIIPPIVMHIVYNLMTYLT